MRATFLRFALLFAVGALAYGGSLNTIAPSGTPQPAPPLPPYGVYVESDEDDPTKVTIHWSPGSWDHSGFIVERSRSSSAFAGVASTGASATEAEDQGLYADRRYKYRVRAFRDIPDGRRLFSASSTSRPYQPPIFKGFSGKFTSDSRRKYGFDPLTDTEDRSERYLEHVLWGNYQYSYDVTIAATNATYTDWGNGSSSYYRKSVAQRWHAGYVESGDAHSEYEFKELSTQSEPVYSSYRQYTAQVQTDDNGFKYSQWVEDDTEVSDPIGLAYPYAKVEPDSFTPVSARYSVEFEEVIAEGAVSASTIESGSAGEDLSSKFENVTFAEEVIEDAPALDQQPSIQILAPWDTYHNHLASRAFYDDWWGFFSFATDFCVKDMEIHSCDGSDYDYIVAKQTDGNGEDGPEMEYTLTSFRLSGSSAKIDPIDVTEDLTEEDADGMIAQNADWSVRAAPKLLAYDSAWPLDEFEKVSPGLVVGKKTSSAGAIVLNGSETFINDITYTVTWDSGNFEVASDSQVLSSPYIVTAETPRDFGFSIHAKEQEDDENLAASTTFHMKAEVDGSTVGDDEVKVCILRVEIDSNRATIQPQFRGSISRPYLCNNSDHIAAGEKIKGALTIYHKAARDADGETEDFDVILKVASTGDVIWAKTEGPDSGELLDADSSTAIFRNPKKGGLYEFELSLNGQPVSGKLQLWLPVAGPDISSYWESEITYFKNVWGPAYRAKLDDRTVLLALNPPARWMLKKEIAFFDMLTIGWKLDWNEEIRGDETPCGGRIPPPAVTPPGNILTLHGFVISWSKRNNMMYALIGREMGLPELTLINGGHAANIISSSLRGNPQLDAPEAVESYRAGFDLFNGISLENVMKARGLKMQQPNGWDQWEWPSHETSEQGLQRIAGQALQGLIQ